MDSKPTHAWTPSSPVFTGSWASVVSNAVVGWFLVTSVGGLAAADSALTVSSSSADQVPAESTEGRRLHLPERPYEYARVEWPDHFRDCIDRFDNTPPDNPITNAGATLGRVLFYDKTLSRNGSVSCASCHQQSHAFTDGATLSVGFEGERVARNSMSLVNARFYQRGRFFWDERARTLEDQVLMPIENPIEMGHDLDDLVDQLHRDPIYPPLFMDAFGSDVIDATRIAKALAQFVRSIVSYQSKYDLGVAQVDSVLEPFPNFTDEENLGKDVFFRRGNCASCHLSNGLPFNPHRDEAYDSSRRPRRQRAFFTMTRPAVNGVDSDTPGVDLGVGGANGAERDFGSFKSPSLRNLSVTQPYMHDGRFVTIDAVIEHYNWSIRPHPNLDGRLRRFAANGMALPEGPKVALTRFLETLTDPHVLRDPKYGDPFAVPAIDVSP